MNVWDLTKAEWCCSTGSVHCWRAKSMQQMPVASMASGVRTCEQWQYLHELPLQQAQCPVATSAICSTADSSVNLRSKYKKNTKGIGSSFLDYICTTQLVKQQHRVLQCLKCTLQRAYRWMLFYHPNTNANLSVFRYQHCWSDLSLEKAAPSIQVKSITTNRIDICNSSASNRSVLKDVIQFLNGQIRQ